MITDYTIDSHDDSTLSEIEFESDQNEASNYKKLTLNTDYYSITWVALKKTQFVGAKIYGVDIYLLPKDYFWINLNFIMFFLMVVLTLALLVANSVINDHFIQSTYLVAVLRIILVGFAQKKLVPEFESGYAKMLYSLRNHSEFTYSGFATFVAFCQMLISSICLIGIIFFVCIADGYVELITNFSGLCVLSELDDWIGDQISICKIKGCETLSVSDRIELFYSPNFSNPDHKHSKTPKNEQFKLKHINERMSVFNKLALISFEDLEIEYEESMNIKAHWSIVYLEKMIKMVPWGYVIPFMTVPLGLYLPDINEFFQKILFG